MVNIVRATIEHLVQLAPLFDSYRIFYRQMSDLERAARFLTERMKHNESVIFLALDDDEQGLGFTQLYPMFSSISLRNTWILNDLYVAPDAREQGVGQALMNRAREHAEETGAKYLMLQTAIDNYPAQGLYEQLGYRRDEQFYVYYLQV